MCNLNHDNHILSILLPILLDTSYFIRNNQKRKVSGIFMLDIEND